jgi:hypothetical protein
MRLLFIICLALFCLASCKQGNKPAEFVTYRTLPEGAAIQFENQAFLNEKHAVAQEGVYPGLDSLNRLRLQFFDEKEQFNRLRFRYFWENFRQETRNREISGEEAVAWFNHTGFLFQITGEAIVAEELQRIVWQYFLSKPGANPDSLILPYIFTRNTDRIHANLYMPGKIKFNHSLGGNVSVTQETDFPNSGKILIIFETDTKQYIELNVRIPSWAENTSVTVKGVKYLAPPGSYSHIAKKWKDGDKVEINIPLDNLPPYMKPGD